MEKEIAENEIRYQLCRLILLSMQNDGIITREEVDAALSKLCADIQPPIGMLEVRELCQKE